MRRILFFCLWFPLKSVFAQIETKPLNPNALLEFSIENDHTSELTKLYINKLVILDARTDTTNVGYTPEKSPKLFCFKKSFSNELSDWYYSYLNIKQNNASGHTLFINVKKLRLSDEAVPVMTPDNKSSQPKNGWLRGVVAKLEFFIQQDSLYIPLYRFDSIVPFKGHPEKDIALYFNETLKLSVKKLFTIDPVSGLISKRNITLKDILRTNREIYDLPVMKPQYEKGVYLSFNDFKNNKITWADFELRSSTKGDMIFVKEHGSESPQRNVWGFCDGKNFYIRSADLYSRLIQTGNTFYFQGIKSVRLYGDMRPTAEQIIYSGFFGPRLTNNSSKLMYYIEPKYYQLDMETGAIY